MSCGNKYDIGDKVTMRATFIDENGALADPTTVTFKLKEPNGTETSYTIATGVVNDGVGLYHFDKIVDAPGKWHYRWVGVGVVDTAGEAFFQVKSSNFTSP